MDFNINLDVKKMVKELEKSPAVRMFLYRIFIVAAGVIILCKAFDVLAKFI